MSKYGKHISSPQSVQQPIQGEESRMVKNDGGGYTFSLDPFKALERFLILGADGGTYYVNRSRHMSRNITSVSECVKLDGKRTVDMVVDIVSKGRAAKADPCIFAWVYALKKGDRETRAYARAKATEVLRIGTHVFMAADDVKALGGWGRLTREAFASWYLTKEPRDLAYQVTKYRQRGEWSHRDILRKSHPKTSKRDLNVVLAWTADKQCTISSVDHGPIWGWELVREAKTAKQVVKAIQDYNLVREAIPTEWLSNPEVWEALLPKMPLGAMLRNLGVMTSNGLIKPLSSASKLVVEKLGGIGKARVHPLAVLKALKVYSRGAGFKGGKSWTPDRTIVAALDAAFVQSFNGVEPTGKNIMMGIDVSGSMTWSFVEDGLITCAEAAAVMAMVGVRTEPHTYTLGFCNTLVDLGITAQDSLQTAMRKVQKSNFGSTNVGQLIRHATERKLDVDCFQIFTDNEVNRGSHPSQELKAFRRKVKESAKLIVVGMTATNFTIADPNDAGMLDVVGFDAGAPAIMSAFMRD